MDDVNGTALETIANLEARLLRVEQLLYGPRAGVEELPNVSVVESLAELQRRFASLLSRFRVYAELLKICTSTVLGLPTEMIYSRYIGRLLTRNRQKSPLPLPATTSIPTTDPTLP